MPYPKELVEPMRRELTRLGVEELRDAQAVDAAFEDSQDETMLLVINSICGCAAANARPAIALARETSAQPDRYATVFAGQDLEATGRAREYLPGIPPSSPFMALFKDGDPVYVIERRRIEGRSASAIAGDLQQAFEQYCSGAAGRNGEAEHSEAKAAAGDEASDELPSTFRSIM